MDKDYSRRFWGAAARAARASPWLVALIILVLSFLIVFAFEGQAAKDVFFSISKGTWLSVAGSLLASALFLFLHNVLAMLQQAKSQVPMEYFARTHDSFGLKEIYRQRGGDEIQKIYRELLASAKYRIWAIGMTNNSFLEQHENLVFDRCRAVAGMDVVIAFWNPDALLSINGKAPLSIYEVQAKLEERANSERDWRARMRSTLTNLANRTGNIADLRSAVKIKTISLVTNASCFVIDDDVFFFPFLAGSNSNLDPHLRFSANTGIGDLLVRHFRQVFENPDFCHSYPPSCD